MKRIDSRDNPAFKDLRDLAHDARRQRREGLALLEGLHLVAAALEQGVLPQQLVLSDGALEAPEIAAFLPRLAGVPMLVLREALFRALSELKTPPGILAVIAVPPAPSLPTSGDCLLLEAVQDAGNVGALIRTAAAAGIPHVLLGPGCAGAWTQRVLRAAQGAHFALTLHENVDLAAFLAGFAGQSIAAVAHQGTSLYALELAGPTAWLFGNEGQGLSPRLTALATQRATIPLAKGCESLNVAAAAAVCLFEMRRQRGIV